MKKIHFSTFTNRSKRLEAYLLILAAVVLVLNLTNTIKYPSPYLKTAVTLAIYLFVVWLYFKMFWYKNYVRKSKDTLLVRINSFRPQSVKIGTIKKFSYPQGKLKIIFQNNKFLEFDLNNIEEESILKLKDFLKSTQGS